MSAVEALHKLLDVAHDSNAGLVAQFLSQGLPHPRSEYWRWTQFDTAVRQSLQDLSANSPAVLEFSGLTPLVEMPVALLAETREHALFALAQAASQATSRFGFSVQAGRSETLQIVCPQTEGVGASHVQVDVAENADLTIVEDVQAGAGTNLHLREFKLAKGAKLTRIVRLATGVQEARVLPTFVEVGEGAQYTQYVLDEGALQSRVETRVQSAGDNVDIKLNHAYLLQGSMKADQTSNVVLDHLSGTVRQLVKGIVADKAEAVFQGKFLVNRPAQLTDAKMGHHCLLLSEQGRVRAKPELEIYADDVECAHGNTTGMLDESSLFYMRQRGIPMTEARALLMQAYLAEVFEDLLETPAYAAIDTRMQKWLETSR